MLNSTKDLVLTVHNLYPELNFAQIGRRIGRTRERVRQLARAYDKLNDPLSVRARNCLDNADIPDKRDAVHAWLIKGIPLERNLGYLTYLELCQFAKIKPVNRKKFALAQTKRNR